tara:strand:+ start:278 stop:427 length:150 start_codon:yes stop_codon:yes gene_type:complete
LILSALLVIPQPPVQASEKETRHAMAAFAECKIIHPGYSRDRAQKILNT